jgi:hypothetical protein
MARKGLADEEKTETAEASNNEDREASKEGGDKKVPGGKRKLGSDTPGSKRIPNSGEGKIQYDRCKKEDAPICPKCNVKMLSKSTPGPISNYYCPSPNNICTFSIQVPRKVKYTEYPKPPASAPDVVARDYLREN